MSNRKPTESEMIERERKSYEKQMKLKKRKAAKKLAKKPLKPWAIRSNDLRVAAANRESESQLPAPPLGQPQAPGSGLDDWREQA